MSRAQRAFLVLWLGQFVAIAGLTTVVPLLPFYLADLGARDVTWWTGVGVAAPAVAQMVTGPLWGWIGDRFGRKVMVVRAQVGLALALGLMALASTPVQFLACRLLQGAFGGVVSATASYASALAPPHKQGRAFGGLAGATGAGSLVGPLLGSLMAVRFGFGALFAGMAALLAVVSVFSARLLRKSPASGHESTAPPKSVGTARALPLRDAASLLFRQSSNRRLLLAGFVGQAALYALVVVFAPRVGQITGSVRDATLWVGALQAVTWAATLAGGPWWGTRADRFDARRGFLLAAAGCAVAVALQAVPTDAAELLPLRLIQGFCFAALLPSVLQVVASDAPEIGRGSCLGLAISTMEAGQAVGPLVGAGLAGLMPLPGTFCAIAALFALAAVLAVARSHDPEDPQWTQYCAARTKAGVAP
jgi:MFS family permease